MNFVRHFNSQKCGGQMHNLSRKFFSAGTCPSCFPVSAATAYKVGLYVNTLNELFLIDLYTVT